MKTLCIAGARHEILEPTFAALRHAGMVAARTIDRDPTITLALWQQRVLANQDVRESSALRPGRLWEQLATDLFLANIDSPLWGWADVNSVHLLDFWADFEPSVHFVLLCETPQQLVAKLLAQSRSELDIAAALANWQSVDQTMLRFHLRNPGRSVLVWADDAQAQAPALLARLKRQWSLDLEVGAVEDQSPESEPALARYLADHITGQYPELQSLALELHASIRPIDETRVGDTTAMALDAESLIASYRTLCDRSAEHAAIEALTLRHGEAVKATADAVAGIGILEKENAALSASRDTLAREKSTLITARDTETKAKADAQLRIAALEKERTAQAAAADAKLKDAVHVNELLLQQLHQVQEELERLFLKNGESENHLKTLKTQFDAAAKAKAEALDRIGVLEKEQKAQVTVVDRKLKDAVQDNELLLQQLHQVQLALEGYFLKNESVQRDLQTQKDRWENLFKTTPGLYNCDSIDLHAVGDGTDTLAWRLNSLSAGGRVFNSIAFNTVIEQGVAGFMFERQSDGQDTLLRWPVSARKEKEITVIPLHNGEDAKRRAATLVQLASSDWELMQTLPMMLAAAVEGGRVQLPQSSQRQPLLAALARSKQLMAGFKGLVRFDKVTLVGQQQTPQREVLSVQLGNVDYADKRLPMFDFQVQASPGESGFGQTVHLIFPESTAVAPFQSWVSNIKDTADRPVLALRLEANGPDAAIWAKFDDSDRGFVTALVDSLGIFLVTLQSQGVRLERPWQDWVGVAGKLRTWVREAQKPEPELIPEIRVESNVLDVDASPVLDVPAEAAASSKPPRKTRRARAVETETIATAEPIQPAKFAKLKAKAVVTPIKGDAPDVDTTEIVASKPKSRKVGRISR